MIEHDFMTSANGGTCRAGDGIAPARSPAEPALFDLVMASTRRCRSLRSGVEMYWSPLELLDVGDGCVEEAVRQVR